jgi:hypothetical protein
MVITTLGEIKAFRSSIPTSGGKTTTSFPQLSFGENVDEINVTVVRPLSCGFRTPTFTYEACESSDTGHAANPKEASPFITTIVTRVSFVDRAHIVSA